MDELRVMLEEESSKLPTEALKPDESDPKVFRFERGASLLYELQNQMSNDQPQTMDVANKVFDTGEQAKADKRRAFAFRPGMQIMEYGEMLDGGAPAVLPANTVCLPTTSQFAFHCSPQPARRPVDVFRAHHPS